MSAQQPTFCEMVPNHYYTTNRLARYIYVIGSCLDKNSPPQLPMIYLEYGVYDGTKWNDTDKSARPNFSFSDIGPELTVPPPFLHPLDPLNNPHPGPPPLSGVTIIPKPAPTQSTTRHWPVARVIVDTELKAAKPIKISDGCECGSTKCGVPFHSDWCPKYVKT